MLRKFDEGRRDDFFTLWQQYVPASMLGFDFATQKLEFYLQVYFSIYPVLPSSSVLVVTPGPAPGSRHSSSSNSSSSRHELTLRMKAFKGYLEGRGAGLAHTAEFLPYYALPYVPQPEHHPSFEGLFQSRWVDEQRLQLKNFLEGLIRSAYQVPLLYVMYSEHLDATDGVPRLSPRARALRASTRAHPHDHSNRHFREISRGSVGAGGLGLPPAVRASGAGPYGMGSLGGGILAQHEAAAAAGTAGMGTPGRRGGGPSLLPPRGGSRPPSGLEARAGAAAVAAAGMQGVPRRASRTAAGDDGDDDGDLSGLIQDDDDDEGDDVLEEAEERARAAAVLRQPRAKEEDEEDEDVDEQAIAEALRSPSSRDLPPGGFPAPAPAGRKPASGGSGGGGGGCSVALSLERLGLAEDAVFRESVQLLGSTLGGFGTIDEAMASQLIAAGAAAATAASPRGGQAGSGVAASGGSCTGLAPLDYRRLKRDLLGPDTQLAARLLQALRWRLTRSRPGADRWGLIASWIEVDLLDCHSPSQPPPSPPPGLQPGLAEAAAEQEGPCSLLRILATSPDPRVQEEVVRLANAIASDRLGRNYLMLPGGGTVTSLMGVLQTAKMAPESHPGLLPVMEEPGEEEEEEGAQKEEDAAVGEGAGGCGDGQAAAAAGQPPRDGPAVQQALVALQKLSLKRLAQTQMIKRGAMAWLVAFLQDLPSVSPIAVEYGTALLMNLCLRSAGLVAATAVAEPLLRLCENLLRCSNEQVRTYIHGTLYSVFGRAAIRDVANGRGTAELLERVAQSGQAPFAAQSQYILRQLYMPDTSDPELDESSDEAGQDGDADPELEEGMEDAYADVDITPETLEQVAGEPCGEELLCASGYLASTKQARQHLSAVRSSVAAAAAAMAAAGKSTLRGSVLLGTLPNAGDAQRPGQGQGTAPEGGVSERRQVQDSSEEEEEEQAEIFTVEKGLDEEQGGFAAAAASRGQPAAGSDLDGGADEAAGGPLISEPSSTAPSAAGGDDGDADADADADEDDDAVVAAAAYNATLAAADDPSGAGPAVAEDPADAVPAFAAEGCPSPAPSRGPGSRSGSRRPSGAACIRGRAAPLGSSSSAYVTLATSTASTSIMNAVRALEAARQSGASAVGGSTLGASTRRRSAIRPITPSSPAAAAAIKQPWDTSASAAIPENSAAAAAGDPRLRRPLPPPQLALQESRAVNTSIFSETGVGPSASPGALPPSSSQSLVVTQPRPPLPPPLTTSVTSSLASPGSTMGGGQPCFNGPATGGGGSLGASTQINGPTPPRPASRAHSPGFRSTRCSSASARHSSETGSQHPPGATAAAVAAAAVPPQGYGYGDGAPERSSAASLPGATAGAASEALVPTSRLRRTVSGGGREGSRDGGAGGSVVLSGGRLSWGGGLEEERSQGERSQRRRWEPPPPSSSSSGWREADGGALLPEAASRPGTAASAAGESTASRPGTAASTYPIDAAPPPPAALGSSGLRRSEGGNASSAAPSPASSLSASPAGRLEPHPNHHHDNHKPMQQQPPPQQPGRTFRRGEAAAKGAAVGGPRGGGRPGSVQGQPFPITAANPDGFGSNKPESSVAGSLRSSRANSSTNVTPRPSAPAHDQGASGVTSSAASPGGGGGVPAGRTPRGLPRPPPGPGHAGDAPAASADGSVNGSQPNGASSGGPPSVDSTRSPTPPHPRAVHQRSRMGPAAPAGPAASTPAGGDEAELTAFATRRQLPRTPPGSNG